MNSIKDINNNIDHINTIKDISSIFEKIASIKINQIRHDVSARKEFYDTIWDIYVKLKAGNYKDDKLSKNQSKINKTAYVIVSSNSGLIGDMNNKIINLLKKEIKDKERYDVFVIGDKGKRILELEGIRYVKNYSFKDEVNDEFTKEILDDIEKYRKEETRKHNILKKEEAKKLADALVNALKNNVSKFSFKYQYLDIFMLKDKIVRDMLPKDVDIETFATVEKFYNNIYAEFIIKYLNQYYLIKEPLEDIFEDETRFKIEKTTIKELAEKKNLYENQNWQYSKDSGYTNI